MLIVFYLDLLFLGIRLVSSISVFLLLCLLYMFLNNTMTKCYKLKELIFYKREIENDINLIFMNYQNKNNNKKMLT